MAMRKKTNCSTEIDERGENPQRRGILKPCPSVCNVMGDVRRNRSSWCTRSLSFSKRVYVTVPESRRRKTAGSTAHSVSPRVRFEGEKFPRSVSPCTLRRTPKTYATNNTVFRNVLATCDVCFDPYARKILLLLLFIF